MHQIKDNLPVLGASASSVSFLTSTGAVLVLSGMLGNVFILLSAFTTTVGIVVSTGVGFFSALTIKGGEEGFLSASFSVDTGAGVGSTMTGLLLVENSGTSGAVGSGVDFLSCCFSMLLGGCCCCLVGFGVSRLDLFEAKK